MTEEKDKEIAEVEKKTIAQEAAEDMQENAVEEVAEDIAEDDVEEIVEEEETEEAVEKRDIDALYNAIDDMAAKLWDRLDRLAAAVIDAGAVANTAVDEVYDRADMLEDSMSERLEDLDFTIK